jgi:hypothetical protein
MPRRARAGWAGFHRPWRLSFLVVGATGAGQPSAKAYSRVIAAVSCAVQGQVAANSRSRSRLGSQAQARPSGASICIQASSSQAIATSSHQIWFWLSYAGAGFRARCSAPPAIGQPRRRALAQPGDPQRSASSKAPACDTRPFPSADTVILDRHAVFCTG